MTTLVNDTKTILLLLASIILVLVLNVNDCHGFVVHSPPSVASKGKLIEQQPARKQSFSLLILNEKAGDNKNGIDPLTKSAWYAVEVFGNLFGRSTTSSSLVGDEYTGPPKSIQETFDRIKLDNDRSYFLSGQVDEDIYDPDCVFSDPFVSFSGRERFITNLANLGSFITNYSAKVLDYKTDTETVVQTKIMVKLELNLPWKPILAWPWGVKYTIDPKTSLIIGHEESWDIGALDGVKQIFRKPTVQI